MSVDLSTYGRPTLADKAINGHDPGANQAFWFLHGSGQLAKSVIDSVSQTDVENFDVWVKHRPWDEMEGAGSGTTSGPIDWDAFERDYDQAEERGIPIIWVISNRSFAGEDCVPSDMVALWQITNSAQVRSACIFHATPRTRYINFLKAVVNRFKDRPYYAGIWFPYETAGQATCPGATYNGTQELAGWNTILREVTAVCDYNYYCFGFNFSPQTSGVDDPTLAARVDTIMDDVPTDRVIWIMPDLIMPGSPPYWDALNTRVYPLTNAEYSWDDPIESSLLNYRKGVNAHHASHRYSSNATDNYYKMKGDPDYGDKRHDLDADGELDQLELFRFAADELKLDLVVFSHTDNAGSLGSGNPNNNVTIEYTFDRAHGGLPGDDVSVVRYIKANGWNAPHDPDFRQTP